MAIKQAFRRRYIVGLANHHARHKQAVLRVFHKIRSHPGSYRPGYKPSRAAMPKSIPRQPAGLTKKASGFWSSLKKGWSWVKSKFNQHKGKIYEAAKKHGTAAAKHVGSRVLDVGKKAGKQVMDRAVQVAERNVEHYVNKAEKKIQGLADKAEFHISQYDRPPKKGSGIGRYGRQYYTGLPLAFGGLPATGINRRRRVGQYTAKDLLPYVKKGQGVFSARFKRRARAGVQAFRRQR